MFGSRRTGLVHDRLSQAFPVALLSLSLVRSRSSFCWISSSCSPRGTVPTVYFVVFFDNELYNEIRIPKVLDGLRLAGVSRGVGAPGSVANRVRRAFALASRGAMRGGEPGPLALRASAAVYSFDGNSRSGSLFRALFTRRETARRSNGPSYACRASASSSSGGVPGSSPSSKSSASMIAGCRWWRSVSAGDAAVVRIVKLSIASPSLSHRSHSPANDSGSSLSPVMKYGCFPLACPDPARGFGCPRWSGYHQTPDLC